jgi:outer membrane protein
MTRHSLLKKLLGFIIVLTGITPLKAQNLLETNELALQNDPTLKQAQANQFATDEERNQSIARFL